ncbi:ATP-binding cassette sub-family C member 4-like isoform X4 [Sebastes fasciatus]|uniref:ATP-binding cassette sub-family C member 4-like isoform X4 n=1 Tax=Sebastes fasciatus TaxID=394691 RepID=UPI003D9E24E6
MTLDSSTSCLSVGPLIGRKRGPEHALQTARSPVLPHLSSSLQGLWTIRAFGAEERFQKAFDAQQDLHSEAWLLLLTTSRWFAVRLHGICSIFVTVTTFGRLLLRDRQMS